MREDDWIAEIETKPAYPGPVLPAEGVSPPDGPDAAVAFGAPQPPVVGANGPSEIGQIPAMLRAPDPAADPSEPASTGGASLRTASLTTGPELGPVDAPTEDAAFPFDPKAAVPSFPGHSNNLFPGEAADFRVHYPPTGAQSADEMVAALQASGAFEPSAVPVDFSISRTNIRYFHAEDKPAAEAAAKSLIAAGADPEVRDFTDYRPQPAAGVVEIYLAGAGADSAAPAQTGTISRASPPANSNAASRRARVSELNRILLERRVEGLLRARLAR